MAAGICWPKYQYLQKKSERMTFENKKKFQLLGFWMFGTALCKVYRALEHVGRALSTFVLAAMAFGWLALAHNLF